MKKLLFLIAVIGLFSCNTGNKQKTVSDVKSTELVEATIHIGGLHCESCVASVEKGINGLDGIQNVVVTLTDSTAVVKYDASKLKLAEIEKTVEKRGYTIKKLE
uniref:heavy-metal-associated domain-containing protein n=1 Tax=uncultured Draconibacterium sp. TaxID=1573823 RepID=UPI0032179674